MLIKEWAVSSLEYLLSPTELPTRVVKHLIHQKYSVSQPNGTVSRLLEITVYVVKFQYNFQEQCVGNWNTVIFSHWVGNSHYVGN